MLFSNLDVDNLSHSLHGGDLQPPHLPHLALFLFFPLLKVLSVADSAALNNYVVYVAFLSHYHHLLDEDQGYPAFYLLTAAHCIEFLSHYYLLLDEDQGCPALGSLAAAHCVAFLSHYHPLLDEDQGCPALGLLAAAHDAAFLSHYHPLLDEDQLTIYQEYILVLLYPVNL